MKTKKNISITLKAVIVGALILILLIPGAMVQDLIYERQERSIETIERINEKWSREQTLCGPVLSIPYTVIETVKDKEILRANHVLNITPEGLKVDVKLYPEERYFGIYKTILYKSKIELSGVFKSREFENSNSLIYHLDKAYITLGVSDLRGITENLSFNLNGKSHVSTSASSADYVIGKGLVVDINDAGMFRPGANLDFDCVLSLNGSSSINFIPIGKTTEVLVEGDWSAPGFIGSFSPEHLLADSGFKARWKVLSFNRDIPETWINSNANIAGSSFGVSLVSPVDHYQQNMRSAKYAVMFIGLTFMLFFFVELITQKRIHPIQYLLVGIALILFYSLLLSISEQLGFMWAYFIASGAIIALITLYAYSIFKNKTHTAVLAFILGILYMFLYTILQLEDIALLIGSIGLFVILAVVMYFSRKIAWYKQEELPDSGQ